MNLSLNIAASNGPRSSESINCELGLWNNEKEKKKNKKKEKKKKRKKSITASAKLCVQPEELQ